MKSLLHRLRVSARLTVFFVFLGSWALHGEYKEIEIIDLPGAENGGVEVVLDLPPMSMVSLEHDGSLAPDPWPLFYPEFASIFGGLATVQIPIDFDLDFFRFASTPIPFAASTSDESTQVSTEGGIALPLFLDLLNTTAATNFFPQVMDTGNFRRLEEFTIPRGEFSFKNPEDFGSQVGVGLWGVGPREDDEKYAGSFSPTEEKQDGEFIPTPGGEEPMRPWEDGLGERIVEGEILEPGELEMKFTPEIPDVDGAMPLDDDGIFFPGQEARFFIQVKFDGARYEKVLEEAYGDFSEGAAEELQLPPLPPIGSFVIVVRDAESKGFGQIVQIQTMSDPFQERAYSPPGGGSHGTILKKEVSLGFGIPVPEANSDTGLDGMTVEFYTYQGGIEADLSQPDTQPVLTPELFERHREAFAEVISMNPEEMRAVLNNEPEGPDAVVLSSLGSTSYASTSDFLLSFSSISKAPEVTELHRSGSNGSKVNVAIIGDGFRNTTFDQDRYNDYVEDVIMDDFLGVDLHPQILNAMNIFRINTFSDETGVTQVNSSGTVTNFRETALEYRFSGNWSRCWMEGGPISIIPFRLGTSNLINLNLAAVCPQADIVFVVLNEADFGGCAGGNRFAVTRGGSWAVVAHEFGHLFGKLGDEYLCNATNCSGNYTGSEPGAVNLTTSTNRNSVKWEEWIPSWRPIVTTNANVSDPVQDVGIFQGATIGSNRWSSGLFRPTNDGRMRSNSPLYNPVGDSKMRDEARPFRESDLRKNICGDFNGDGRTDVVIHDGRQIGLYLARDRNPGADDPMTGNPPRGVNGVLEPTWFHTDRLFSDGGGWSWQFRGGDKFFVGDFDADGDDDLFIFNGSNWDKPYVCMLRSEGDRFQPVRRYDGNLPGWEMRSGDEHYVADINNDGRDDLLVYNGKDWNQPYFLLNVSANAFLIYVRRYDHYLPGTWEMGRNERFFVGDFNGDGKESIIAQDRDSWNQVHLRVFNMNSSSNALVQASRYYGPIEGEGFTWNMNRKDDLYVGDFDGDGADELALFNGLNWNAAYLGLFDTDAGVLILRRAYSENPDFTSLPGWQLNRKDRFWVGNVDGDGDDDLIVYNSENWDTQYLGICRSNGGSFTLSASWQKDWIGGWNLGPNDDFCVADFRGGAGWDDLFVFNSSWFGLLRSHQTVYQLESINWKWITQHRYHSWGIW